MMVMQKWGNSSYNSSCFLTFKKLTCVCEFGHIRVNVRGEPAEVSFLLLPCSLFSCLFFSLCFFLGGGSQTYYSCFFLTTMKSELLVLLDGMDKAAAGRVERGFHQTVLKRGMPSVFQPFPCSATGTCLQFYIGKETTSSKRQMTWHRSQPFLFF